MKKAIPCMPMDLSVMYFTEKKGDGFSENNLRCRLW